MLTAEEGVQLLVVVLSRVANERLQKVRGKLEEVFRGRHSVENMLLGVGETVPVVVVGATMPLPLQMVIRGVGTEFPGGEVKGVD